MKLVPLTIELPLRANRRTRVIICDESSHTKDNRYCVLGAMFYEVSRLYIETYLELMKQKHYLNDEVKWGKAPSREGTFSQGYKAFAKCFIDLPLSYKALIIDTHTYPLAHPVHSPKDSELGYYIVLLSTSIQHHSSEP